MHRPLSPFFSLSLFHCLTMDGQRLRKTWETWTALCLRVCGQGDGGSATLGAGIYKGTMKDKAETDVGGGVATSSCLVRACVQLVRLSLHSLGNHPRLSQSTVCLWDNGLLQSGGNVDDMCAGTMGQIMRVWLTKTAFIHLEKYGMYIVIPKARYTQFFASLREYHLSGHHGVPRWSGHLTNQDTMGYLANQNTSPIRTPHRSGHQFRSRWWWWSYQSCDGKIASLTHVALRFRNSKLLNWQRLSCNSLLVNWNHSAWGKLVNSRK